VILVVTSARLQPIEVTCGDNGDIMRQDKKEEAIAYLRSRQKYLLDQRQDFVPTSAVETDVAETMRRYRLEAVPFINLVGKNRK
jgi:hypothetical protein